MKRSVNRIDVRRVLEIVPGFISWTLIVFIFLFALLKPLEAAVLLIVYLFFWATRLLYMTTLLMMAHHRMMSKKHIDWIGLCKQARAGKKFDDILHVVMYTVYKEPPQVIIDSMSALSKVDYPKEKIIVVLAGEEREKGSLDKLKNIKERFRAYFKDILVTIHPEGLPGEIPGKGGNATYAAKKVKEYLERLGCDFGDVIISCFDADTCPDKNYFSCLTYNFLNHPNPYQSSFQPLPIYSNNIYVVPAFARVIEMGSMFWQLIESMRYEKFVTFSSHSMSFKTLVEVGYWPVDLVSDDSLIFWKCFIHFDGNYTTYSLEVPVYMDIAAGRGFWHTFLVQYKQKRRWAWGVETLAFVGERFINNPRIPLGLKLRKMFQILDSHINWSTWAIITSIITPLLLLWGSIVQQNSLVLFNLSYMNSAIFNSLSLILLLCIFISKEFLPPRPPNVSRFIYVSLTIQWFLIPLVSAVLGSFPALDAQTRLMRGRHLGFYPTPKRRENSFERT